MSTNHSRQRTKHRRTAALVVLVPLGLSFAAAAAPATRAAKTGANGDTTGIPAVDFSRQILPLLADRCFNCHGPDAAKSGAGLRLDVREGALARRPNGRAAIVPGKPETSEFVRRILAENGSVMPPRHSNKTLSHSEKELLKQWIAEGAEYRRHWAFVAPKRPALPRVKWKGWVRNPIDAFVLARLEREGLQPAPTADRTTLIRRLSLDLTGVPPTPAEVDAFLADRSPDAYEKVVDRLLASPRYGERMAWDWLDAARYADTNGYQGDRTRTMWFWRDWVIDAFNRNMPFDQFTVEQLAGDLLPNATVAQKIATGFNRNHMLNGEGGRIPEESRVDYVVDRVDTTSTVWMGLTVGCARCHDHKYDPITQKEYYGLFAYFNNLPETGSVDRNGQANPVLLLPTPAHRARLEELTRKVQTLEAELKAAADPAKAEAQSRLDAARKALRDTENSIPAAMVMAERPEPRETFVLLKGAYDKPGEKVAAGIPSVLPPLPAGNAVPNNRLALARWLVSPEHPLTARVTVNRFWQSIFGTGLVKTSEDFGIQGELPSPPVLVDYWASTFGAGVRGQGSESGDTNPQPLTPDPAAGLAWNLKALLKLIVTSNTYKQSSRVTPELLARDPENRLLARGARYRLTSAAIRDQALAASGLLVEKVGGPPVKPYQPPGVWADATFGKITYQQDKGEALYRRSLYTFWRRIVGPTNLFDTAARQQCTVRTARTNTPLHALTLLNDITYVEAARTLAQRVMTGEVAPQRRIESAFRLAASRLPRPTESMILLQRLERLREQYAADPAAAKKLLSIGDSPRDEKLDAVEHAAYTGLCSLILNLDEVITRE